MPVVFITGGARRIGRALVERFCAEGYSVFFTFNTSSSDAALLVTELSERGFVVHAIQCDVTIHSSVVNALEVCVHKLGVPSVIVSNAGEFPDPVQISELTEEQLFSTMQTNTFPLLTLSRQYVRLLEQGNLTGRMIAITSVGAFETWKNRTQYNVSKSAQHALMLSIARNVAPRLSVNAVAPGAIVFNSDPTKGDKSAGSVESIPMNRYGTGRDVADAVLFFAKCTTYITGQTIAVDGGYLLTR